MLSMKADGNAAVHDDCLFTIDAVRKIRNLRFQVKLDFK